MSVAELRAKPRLEESMAEKVRRSGTSFYAAMRLLPRARRNAMFAIYAFCREVDDIADEAGLLHQKLQALEEWREEIRRLYQGHEGRKEISRALAVGIREFGLAEQDFIAVIDGMEMDAKAPIVAPTWKELDLYCDRVASAVGRLSVRAFGDTSAEAIQVAHHLGRALQLTNILRDIDEDSARGRLYLPRESLEAVGLANATPKEIVSHPGLEQACQPVLAAARQHFQKAQQAMRRCRRSAMRPARLMGAVYRDILERLAARGWRRREPVSLPTWRKFALLLRHGII